MDSHASESYFVIGEGLLSESVGGRDDATRRAGGAADGRRRRRSASRGWARAARAASSARRSARSSASAMTAGGGGAAQIPAGFTYLGQFIDHDLTFDKTTVMLGENVSPPQLLQAPLAEPRPRLALRRRARATRSRRSSTRPTAST